MNFFIFVILSLLVVSTSAQTTCGWEAVRREIPMPVNPTYFIRVDTKADRLFMSGECTLSLSAGRCVSAGKTWEPYPIAGKNILIIPHCDNKLSMCFYKTSDFKSGDESKPFFIDSEMKGYYQSIGTKAQSQTESEIRLVAYYGVYRDYKVSDKGIIPVGEAREYCPGEDIKLPMISKKANILSAWNLKTEETTFFRMGPDGSCTPIHRIPEMLSKMDFDFNDKRVGFHSTTNPLFLEDPVRGRLKAHLMDLETKKKVTISHSTDSLYYPHFGQNGLVYILRYKKDKGTYSVLEVDPEIAMKQAPDACMEPVQEATGPTVTQ